MYAEFNKTAVLSMLNSETFLVKEEEEGIKFDILKRSPLEFEDECAHAAASIHNPEEEVEAREESTEPTSIISPNFTEVHKEEEEEEEEDHEAVVSEESGNVGKLSLGQLDQVTVNEEEDDGFRTPTSLDHKIPVVKECPPAPRKPKSSIPSRKRKASSPNARRRLQVLDLTEEVESLLPKPDFPMKIKKTRREEN